MRVKVCIPYYLDYESIEDGLAELANCASPKFEKTTGRSYDPGAARNKLVSPSQKIRQELSGQYSHYLFIDSDQTFTLTNALELIEKDKDIIAGAYLTRDDTEVYNVGMWVPGREGVLQYRFHRTTEGLKKVDFCGAGFLLVKAHVFEQMAYPWFRRYVIRYGDYQEEISEDYGFCVNAGRAGFDIWCDFDTVIGHNVIRPGDPGFIPSTLDEEYSVLNH
jgi:hypothetical protein